MFSESYVFNNFYTSFLLDLAPNIASRLRSRMQLDLSPVDCPFQRAQSYDQLNSCLSGMFLLKIIPS